MEKQEKAREKTQSKNLSIGMKRLAISNSQAVEFDIFKDILSDLAITPLNNETLFSQEFLLPDLSNSFFINTLTAIKLENSKKKKTKDQTFSGCHDTVKRSGKAPTKSSMPPPVAIKLIKPGKQKVQVPTNIVESTSLKHMQ